MRLALPTRSLGAGLAAALPLLVSPGRVAAPVPAVVPTASAAAGLAVRVDERWLAFWRADSAPARWAGPHPTMTRALASSWRPGAEGVRWAELEVSGRGEAWRTRVVVAQLDPRRVSLRLVNGAGPGGLVPVWAVGDAADDAVVAANAGQFSGAAVWGWVVHEGREYRAPGRGPLVTAVVVGEDGSVSLIDDAGVARLRAAGAPEQPAGVAEGFQSYPTLLAGDGEVPAMLQAPGRGPIDLDHRDARLALCRLEDGQVLLALTRFDALGGALGGLPFGLTVPEMAGVMGALGCRQAVALDGGLSAQLLVREPSGARRAWTGMRRVPLGLVALSREAGPAR
jgi:hypothetical protein